MALFVSPNVGALLYLFWSHTDYGNRTFKNPSTVNMLSKIYVDIND